MNRKQRAPSRKLPSVTVTLLQKWKKEMRLRKAAEQALRESDVHYRHLLNKSRLMQKQLRQLSHQILMVQEEERKEISRELHDHIAQTLSGINVHLATLKAEAAVNTKGLQKKISSTQRLVEKSVNLVHKFACKLRPTLLEDLGIIPALQSYIKDFTKRTNLPVHFTSSPAVEQLTGAKRTILYRVALEALANAAQHAQASQLKVSIQKMREGIRIRDDGKSFSAKREIFAKRNGHLGLVGMRERVEMVGGQFSIESIPGKGTTLQAQVFFK